MPESLVITSPDSFDEAFRTNTSFGLRPLEHAHDEEVVPKIGALEFVRQASWAVAAIKLFYSNEKVRAKAKTPTTLANAIEALGCKLEFANVDDYHRRGTLAFKRPNSENFWTFDDLKKKSNYVQNTYRQNVVSALLDLGLCDERSIRFNQMQLTEIGETLADNFLNRQERDVKNILTYWVCNDSAQKTKDYMHFLSPDFSSAGEKQVIRQCLNSRVFDEKNLDPEKRIRLIRLMEKIAENEDDPWSELRKMLMDEGSQGVLHVQQIENAIRFESIKNCARALYNACANIMFENNSDNCSFAVLCKMSTIVDAHQELKNAVELYRDEAECELPAIAEINTLINHDYKDVQDTLRYLVSHEGRALVLNGSGVTKGPLLKKDGFAPVDEANGYWEHPKLWQLARLWRNCNG